MNDNDEEAVIAGHGPVKVSLKKGQDYHYCTCGRSKNQPFCDGSHQGTSFTPMKFTVEQDGLFQLCQCKRTNQVPFCDGAHLKLS